MYVLLIMYCRLFIIKAPKLPTLMTIQDIFLSLIYTLGLGFTPAVFSQQTDPHPIIKQVKQYRTQRHYDSAIQYLENSLKAYEGSLADSVLLEVYAELGANYYLKKEYENAIDAYQNSLSYHESLQPYKLLYYAYTIKSLGMSHRKLAQYDIALDYFLQAIHLLDDKQEKHYSLLGECYTLMGNVYRKLSQDSLSIVYQKKSLAFWQSTNHYMGLAMALHNLGLSERKLSMYSEAIEHFSMSLAIKKANKYTNRIPKTISNLGDVFYLQHQYDSALFYYKIAYHLRDSLQDLSGKAITLNNLASTYLAIKQFGKANDSLKKLAEIIDEAKDLNTKKEYYLTQSTFHFSKQNMSLGYQYLNKYQDLRDSIYTIEMTKEIADAETRYKTQEIEQTAVFEKTRAETNLKLNYLLAFIIVLILISIYWIGRTNLKISRQKDEITQQKHFIEELMRELHHRIKNNFAVFSGLLMMQRSRTTDHDTKLAIQEIENRLQSMSAIHQKLYQGSQSDRINTKEYLTDLVEKLLWSYEFRELQTNFHLINKELTANKALILGFLVNEVITNTLKYAYKGITNPELTISMQEQKEHYKIHIEDNGIGFNEVNKDNSKSYGQKLIKGFTKQLKGTYAYSSSPKGTKFELTFPL